MPARHRGLNVKSRHWFYRTALLMKMGFNSVEELKAGNLNKVFNDLGGMRKKMKLDITMPGKEDVERWFG